MGIAEARDDAGLNFKSIKPSLTPKIMDFRPSKGLASGMKRIGGRGGVSRLGRQNRLAIHEARRGRPTIMHKF